MITNGTANCQPALRARQYARASLPPQRGGGEEPYACAAPITRVRSQAG